MTFVQWNCRGLRNKRIWLQIPPFSSFQFWIFQETFFNTDYHLHNPNITFFHSCRLDRSGGVLTGIPKTAAGRIIPTLFSEDTNLELLATEIHFNNHKFIIVNLYAPQGFDIQQAKSFSISVIISGDFNFHHPVWNSNNSTPLSNSFVDWLQNSNFVMLNTSTPTYASYTGTNSRLDLTLYSTSIYHQIDCFVSDSTFESDHNPVVTTWSLLGQSLKTIKTFDWNSIITNSSEILSSTNSDLHTVMRKVSRIIKNNTKHTVLPVANGVHSPLFRQSWNPCIQLNKKDQEAFVDLNITFDQIITLPNILDVLHNDICEIHLTSFGFQDKAQPTSMIKALFEETISEEFQDYFIITTDSSKSHLYTSIAGTSNLRSFSFRIHPNNFIFTAEALAICQARLMISQFLTVTF
ncbi:hypothetical protein AVEN_29061-1 [Araneus ventricosus]|uniref:Endonuclease/exonuclease/phosphatase domain-containing protein n=1 Tax=Araneus ventricosus TaxID=182803 RepID=A0A4Y2AJS2_ARAVE|nr:hypothetical protein AVEN_29061-1 [Araneus ventricosus]